MQVESAAFAAGRRPVGQRRAGAGQPDRGVRRRRRSTWRTCTTTATTRSTAATSPATPAARGSARRSTTCRLGRGGVPGRGWPPRPRSIRGPMHSPDILLIQEAEDQDICTVSGGALVCGAVDNADGKPDTLQELALADRRRGRARPTTPRTTVTARTTAASWRRSCTAPTGSRSRRPARACSRRPRASTTGRLALAYNADVQNPKSLNADLPVRCGHLHRRRRLRRLHPGPAGGEVPRRRRPRLAGAADAVGGEQPLLVHAGRAGRAAARAGGLRRGHRRARSRPRDPHARDRLRRRPQRVPAPGRPDRHVRRRHAVGPARRRSTTPACATCGTTCSRTHRRPPTPTSSRARRRRWTTSSSTRRSTATWCRCGRRTSTPAGRPTSPATARAASSDHDPQVARFRSRASLTVADVTVAEGDRAPRRRPSPPRCPGRCRSRSLVCAATLGPHRVGSVRLQRAGPVPTLAAGRHVADVHGDRQG